MDSRPYNTKVTLKADIRDAMSTKDRDAVAKALLQLLDLH